MESRRYFIQRILDILALVATCAFSKTASVMKTKSTMETKETVYRCSKGILVQNMKKVVELIGRIERLSVKMIFC